MGRSARTSTTRTLAILLAALVCGVAVVPVVLATDHQDAKAVWAVFGPVAGWSFVGTGLYAARLRPESRVGRLMILLGFAWFLAVLGLANAALPYTLGQILGGLWGAVFLQLVVTFPSGYLSDARDRTIVVAGYVIFTVASVPALLFAAPHELGCDECPANVLLVDRDATLARIALALQALLYLVLFAIVLVRLTRRWRRTSPLERLQLTPVYASGLLTFLLVTAGQAGAGDVASWAAFAATAMLPLGFLAGLLRSHVARLVGQARGRMSGEAEIAPLLDRALEELKTSLAELRELARGLHPAVLSDRGLEPAVEALAGRSPFPVRVDAESGGERLPAAIEIAAYYIVSEALVNVAKYARATAATVTVRRAGGHLTVEVADDGIGGADAGHGSGLRGLADRLEALDGTLAVDSPPGRGTRVRAEIPTA